VTNAPVLSVSEWVGGGGARSIIRSFYDGVHMKQKGGLELGIREAFEATRQRQLAWGGEVTSL